MKTRILLLTLGVVCSMMFAQTVSAELLLKDLGVISGARQDDINTGCAYSQSGSLSPVSMKETNAGNTATPNFMTYRNVNGMYINGSMTGSGAPTTNYGGYLYDFKSYDGLKYTIQVQVGETVTTDQNQFAGFTIAAVSPNTSQGPLGSTLGFKIAKSGAWAAYDFNATPFATGAVAGTPSGTAGKIYTITATLKKSGAAYKYNISINDGTENVLVTDHVVTTAFAANYFNIVGGTTSTGTTPVLYNKFKSVQVDTVVVDPPIVTPPVVNYGQILFGELFPFSTQQDINTTAVQQAYRQGAGMGNSTIALPVNYKESDTANWAIYLDANGLNMINNQGNGGNNFKAAGLLYDFIGTDYLKYTMKVKPNYSGGALSDQKAWGGFTIACGNPNTSQGTLGSSLGFKISKSGAWEAYDFNATPFATGTVAGTATGTAGMQYTITAKLERVDTNYLYSISINDGTDHVLVENHVVWPTTFSANYINLLAGTTEANGTAPIYTAFQSVSIETSLPVYPKMSYSDDITIDGNLDEWAGAEWVTADKQYWATAGSNWAASDISNVEFAWKWGAGGAKVYIAAKAKDTAHIFMDSYTDPLQWDDSDRIEAQIWAAPTGSTNYGVTSELAQQYNIGLKSNHVDFWTGFNGNNVIPAEADFNSAVKEDGEWYYYELAMTPFEFFGALTTGEYTKRILAEGDIIGADAVMGSHDGANYRMLAANDLKYKSSSTTTFQKWELIRTGVQGMIDLANYDGVKLGVAGTVVVTDGSSTETHKIVLDESGSYSFTTALRGDCTAIAKCSHWLAKSMPVTINADGDGTVDFSLINGDIDDDNYIGNSDYDIWAGCYDTSLGDAAFNPMADLDGDDYVGNSDYDIWAGNYDISGD